MQLHTLTNVHPVCVRCIDRCVFVFSVACDTIITQAGESTVEAATRELFEEVGMRVGHTPGLRVVGELPNDDAFCYAAGGWLTTAGLAGQRLAFCLFHLATDDANVSQWCDLGGHGEEKAEFLRVKWQSLDDAVNDVWEPKRAPYVKAKELAAPLIAEFLREKASPSL